MIQRIALAIILILVSTLLIYNVNFTGKVVEGECSGNNSYYLCVVGDGDFVLGSYAIQETELTDIVDTYNCKLVSLEDKDGFVFRYTNNAFGGRVYNFNQQLLGYNENSHTTANYKCHIDGDCSLSCSEYRVFE